MLKTDLCFKFFFRKLGEFVKLKTEVIWIIIFYSNVIFSSKKNVENRRKTCRQLQYVLVTQQF